jgi:hypothetical protein
LLKNNEIDFDKGNVLLFDNEQYIREILANYKENELEEIIMKDETPNDEEYKKFINYFENSSCEKYFEKYIKEIKKNIKL